MTTIEKIKANQTYKQVIAESFGGVLYNVANRGKYDATEILNLWESLSAAEQESVGGIMKGAIDFLYEN